MISKNFKAFWVCSILNFLVTPHVFANTEWEKIRAVREKQIATHVASDPQGFSTLMNGSIGQGPFPALVFALLPEMFPALWGPAGQHMQKVGLSKNPYTSNHKLPLGIGMESVPLDRVIGDLGKDRTLNMAGFNCAACHSGQVEIRSGVYKPLLGAPNTRIDNIIFLFARTTTHPDFQVDKILAYLRTKPLGSLYGNSAQDRKLEAQDRKVFMEEGIAQAVVDSIRTRGQSILGGFEKFIRSRTYDAAGQTSPDPYARKRGSMDALVAVYLPYVSLFAADPAKLDAGLPRETSEVDAPSIWKQRGLGSGHWDGSILSPIHRNVGAAAAGLNNPVNVPAVHAITAFTEDLPSTPYPFEVNLMKAKKGEKLFNQNCATCHSSQNTVYPAIEIGTSLNRLNHFTPIAAGFLADVHMSICTDKIRCLKPDGTSYLPQEITRKTNGYIAAPLDGIWARAPFLHNGSVPTLYALLTGERPKKFYRGNLQYDQRLVGFKWNEPGEDSVIYDTELSGNSNLGHSGKAFLGFNPKQEPQKLWDLIEYLKTL